MRRHSRLMIVGLAAVVTSVACASDSTAPSGPPNISGTWTLHLNISNSQLAASCSAQGVVVDSNQTGSTFTGTTVSGSQLCSIAGTSQSSSLARLRRASQISDRERHCTGQLGIRRSQCSFSGGH